MRERLKFAVDLLFVVVVVVVVVVVLRCWLFRSLATSTGMVIIMMMFSH